MNLTSGFNEKDMEMLRNAAIGIEKVTGIMKVVSSCGGSLWIGSRACAARQDTFTLYNVQAVLNVSDDVPFYYSDQEDVEIFGRRIEKFRVPVRDLPSEDLKRYFMQATDFIKGCLDENKSVLVHCSMGISRSATVVIAYLIRFEKLTLVEAYGKVKSARDCICPNFGFLEQLGSWEEEQLMKSTFQQLPHVKRIAQDSVIVEDHEERNETSRMLNWKCTVS